GAVLTLTGAVLSGANPRGACFDGMTMEGVHCCDARFDRTDLIGADLSWVLAYRASFRGACLVARISREPVCFVQTSRTQSWRARPRISAEIISMGDGSVRPRPESGPRP